MAVALAQPHRAGGKPGTERSWHRWCKVGRLIVDGKVTSRRYGETELHEAVRRYAEDYRNLQWVMASRNGFAVGGKTMGVEMTADLSDAIRRAWSNVSRELAEHGERITKAAQFAILDDPTGDERTLAPWIVLTLPIALDILCRHYGLQPS